MSGALDKCNSFDVTTVIGREFPDANLKEWLEAENSDELLRDLAITSKYIELLMLRNQIAKPLTDVLQYRSVELYFSESRIV